ncbi:uncharacterized protein LOC118439722 [Vespa mandarinia]|uniref:uncharacterized protein LOC118439722 n=1 Tax=Vespa mandarinia TaxID=7446 RepID=UPI00161FDDF9|nr:uncharacterized protein LOC118439722 [Vespa mandarinia]
MDLSHLLQELQICKENVAIYKKLITLNLSFKHLLTKKNKEEWQLILLNIMEVLTSNQDMGKEWILLASHAFFILQSAQCDAESLQRYLAYFLEVDSSELFFINKIYKINHLELFKLIITHGYLQVNQKKIYSNNVLCIIFKIIYSHCVQYTPYSYFAYKILNTWLNRSIYTDFWNTNSLLIEQQLEMIIFSNWCNSINDINKQNATYIFNTYLRIMIEKYNGFLEYVFNCVDSLSWQNETKYIILAEVCNMPKCKIAMITSEHFLLYLSTSLTKNYLRCVGTKVYMNILKRLTEKDWKKSFDSVIKYLVYQWEIGPNKNHNALKSLCKYWLEPTITKYKNILLHLWELCKDFVAPFFHSHLQRIANEMYITFPQDIDLISYIHHKDEVIRLNGFAIYCYQSSKLLNNDKVDHFIIIKQFLWYNANTTSIFLRDGITQYFKIFYTNVLKSSENFDYNQYICDMVDWLHEFLLDCFEPGSRYQRKILGLNLYKVVLSITDTYFCKYLIEKEHNSPIMLHNKCTKGDIKCKFTNKKCLLVLLKLLQDSTLDIKQTATYIIINYFEKDVLTNTEKKVIFDMGLKNCNSSKFYEVESGAALMKILATWEPFNTEFITNKCEKSALCNNYYEFFLYEAQKQLLQMKEDILKAIVHSGSFYGILTAMLSSNFEHGLENCRPPLNFIKKLLDFLDDAITFFLSILSSKSTTTKYASSFAEMGLAINDTIKTSAINDDNYDDLILSPAHQVIVSCIWLSLKVSCEIANNIGSCMYSNETTSHAIKLIAMVLTKCRHKGAIEAAGIAIGNLVRCICKKDSYAEILKMYVKDLLEDKTTNTLNITRRGAGFSLMFHKIVSNDNRKGRPLLHFSVQKLLYSLERWSETKFENIEYKYDLPLARHLYFLRTLVADKNIHVQLTPYMERISLVCFQYLRSEIWQIRNASLQLFGSIIPRLVGQSAGGKELDFGNGYSVNHFITHYPILTNHILKQLQVFSQLSENSNTMLHEYSNIVHILILLSKFSISGCDFIDYLSYDFVKEMKSYFCKLLANPIEHVRILTGKAYAALTAFSCIKSEIEILKFNVFLIKNVNKIHGHLLTIKYLKEKFLAEAENINSCKTMESTIINSDEKCISEYRIQNIVKIWNNKLKTKSNQQIYYTLECILIELFNLKLSPSNIEYFDRIILDSLCILHMEKIKPSFYQFIDILTYLYADHIKYTGNFNSKIIDKIVHSEYIEQTINFLTRLHCFTPILKIILRILLSIIDNDNALVINAIIKFVITTFKCSLLIDIYKLKLEETVLNLIPKLDKDTSHINVLHFKNILIAIFCKDESIIYKTLSAIFNMSLTDNEYVKNEASECLQFFVQRFSEVESKNKLIIMHCCLILLKNDTSDICNSVTTIVQNHIMSAIYGDKKMCEHDEIIYQQLLLEIEYYTSLCNSFYLNDNIEFIRKFIGLDKLHTRQSSLVENPFNHEDNTFYKEETKFMNILYFYMQSNKKYYRMLKYESNTENCIDVSHIIQSKCQFLEKTGFNLNCLRNLLTLKDKDYLFKKQETLIYEYKNKKQ